MLKILSLTTGKRRTTYSDAEVVEGLQRRDGRTEEWFYNTTKRYFDDHFGEVFFDKDKKQEIFQMAFLKLWTEISNGKITLIGEAVCRQQKDGGYKSMTCRLTTFLMTFATNEYRELVRTNRLDTYAEVYENVSAADMVDWTPQDENPEARKSRIVDDCIQQMSPRCIEILTLFYYHGKSLDEILKMRQDKGTSKNGLKTAKNKCMNTLRAKAQEVFVQTES